jgi:hypothetical protein
VAASIHIIHREALPKRTKPQFSQEQIHSIYWAYPRHKEPANAYRAIEKALNSIDSPDPYTDLLAVVREYAQSTAGNQGRFTPYPASFFNAKSYLEDPSEWEK